MLVSCTWRTEWTMHSFTDIIAQWETVEAFRQDMGVPYQRARKWRDRNNIPPNYWQKLICVSRKRGVKGVNAETLTKIKGRGVTV